MADITTRQLQAAKRYLEAARANIEIAMHYLVDEAPSTEDDQISLHDGVNTTKQILQVDINEIDGIVTAREKAEREAAICFLAEKTP